MPQPRMTDRLWTALQTYRGIMEHIAAEAGIDWTLPGAIAWRESDCGLALDENMTGDHGHGRGLMQIDDRSHPVDEMDWKDPWVNIGYAVNNVLMPEIKAFGGDVKAALAAYNTGRKRVKKAIARGEDPDKYTTGHNYGKDVLLRQRLIQNRLGAAEEPEPEAPDESETEQEEDDA